MHTPKNIVRTLFKLFVLGIFVTITSSYAYADVPEAAQLLDETANPYTSTGTQVTVTNVGSMYGLATDGTNAYIINSDGNIVSVPFSSINISPGTSDTVSGTVHTVGWGGESPSWSGSAALSLTYSNGCLFITNDSNAEGEIQLYCIDVSDYSVTQIPVPSEKPLPAGGYYAYSNLVDFPDGRIGKVSTFTEVSEGVYISTLRTYDVSGTGKNVELTWSEDILMQDSSNWAVDEHGLGTDGTYLYRIQWRDVNPNTKVWQLQSGATSTIVYQGNFTRPFDNMHFLAHNHTDNYYLVGYWSSNKFFITTAADPGPGPGNPLTPQFGEETRTADGFTVAVTNYDETFEWSVAALQGEATINSEGIVTVTGLEPGGSTPILVTAQKTGIPDGSADFTGYALEGDDGLELVDGLVAYWDLDEDTGETRIDSFGDNDLVDADSNVVGVSDGVVGQAAQFTEDASHLVHADNPELSTGGDTSFSLSLWVRMNEIDGTQVFVSKFDDVSTGEYAVYAEDGEFRFSTYSGGIGYYVSGLTAEAGEWYHLIAVHNAEDGTNMLAVNVSPTNTISEVPQHEDSNGDFMIGAFGPLLQYPAKSEIDEVGFWKRVLSSQDIEELYNNGEGLRYSDFAHEQPQPQKTHRHRTQTRSRSLSKTSVESTEHTNRKNVHSVIDLQRFLNAHGFLVSSTGPGSLNNETDIFGQLTKNALIKFQQQHGIVPAVGYFGPITKKIIENILNNDQNVSNENSIATVSESNIGTRDLEVGLHGDDVKRLQEFLIAQNIGPQAKKLALHGSTEYFGQLTKAALAEWQQAKGISPATGYFGARTRELMQIK